MVHANTQQRLSCLHSKLRNSCEFRDGIPFLRFPFPISLGTRLFANKFCENDQIFRLKVKISIKNKFKKMCVKIQCLTSKVICNSIASKFDAVSPDCGISLCFVGKFHIPLNDVSVLSSTYNQHTSASHICYTSIRR